MGIEAREKRIGDHVYRVTLHGTKAGLKLLVRVTKILGPGAGSFIGGLGRDAIGLDGALANGAAEALHDFAARLNETEVLGIADEFARQTVVVVDSETEPRLCDIFDDHFAGRYDLLLQWLGFCLEVNYGSFFVARSGVGPLQKLWKLISALPSRATSTGSSIASPAATATPTA